jgi:chromosome partitioning protein
MDNLSIILGSERLVELESELHGRHKIYKLREALVSLSKEFDHTYIDTAPDRCLITLALKHKLSRSLVAIVSLLDHEKALS